MCISTINRLSIFVALFLYFIPVRQNVAALNFVEWRLLAFFLKLLTESSPPCGHGSELCKGTPSSPVPPLAFDRVGTAAVEALLMLMYQNFWDKVPPGIASRFCSFETLATTKNMFLEKRRNFATLELLVSKYQTFWDNVEPRIASESLLLSRRGCLDVLPKLKLCDIDPQQS
jgi:hypothetical protein